MGVPLLGCVRRWGRAGKTGGQEEAGFAQNYFRKISAAAYISGSIQCLWWLISYRGIGVPFLLPPPRGAYSRGILVYLGSALLETSARSCMQLRG